MIAEATCIGKPFAIIPLVVTEVQDVSRSATTFRPTHRRSTNLDAGDADGLPAAAVRRRAR
jgi:hypothetical protein